MRLPLTLLTAAVLFIAMGCSEDGLTSATSEVASEAQFSKNGGNADQAALTREYSITVENLTSGQPLTPPTLTTHNRSIGVFTVGEAASFEIKEIAENGNLGPMIEALDGNRAVSDFVVASAGDPPPILPGASVTATITTNRGGKFLSFASMLVCTNDGFTGIDSMKLPNRLGQTAERYTQAYDAGTEINTEDFADIVPPCQGLVGVSSDDEGTGASNPELAENGVIHHHPGVAGGDDLVADPHGWDGPVAKVTITRVK